MNRIIYILLLGLILISCNNSSNEEKTAINVNKSIIEVQKQEEIAVTQKTENVAELEKEKIVTIDSLITLLLPNADKDSLINSIDSAIFSYFNDAKPAPTKDELEKLKKEKHILYKMLNDVLISWGGVGFNEESWKKADPLDAAIGDAEDGRNFSYDMVGLLNRLVDVSFQREKETYLNLLSGMETSAFFFDDFSRNLHILERLFKCQIQNNYVDTNTLKEFEHLYELTPYEIEYDFNIYQEIKIDIIRLKRIIDLCNSDAYYDIKNLDSQNFRFLKTKELKLLKLLSVKDLHKLDYALYLLNTTDNDWVVIQSYIEIIHAFNNYGSYLCSINDDTIYAFIDKFKSEREAWSQLNQLQNIGVNIVEMQGNWSAHISFDHYTKIASHTIGNADDSLFELMNLKHNFKTQNGDHIFSSSFGVDDMTILHYLKLESEFKQLYRPFSDTFSLFQSNEFENSTLDHSLWLKNQLINIRVTAVAEINNYFMAPMVMNNGYGFREEYFAWLDNCQYYYANGWLKYKVDSTLSDEINLILKSNLLTNKEDDALQINIKRFELYRDSINENQKR
jgi:hypothetical protein